MAEPKHVVGPAPKVYDTIEEAQAAKEEADAALASIPPVP
jgi:hypothetical protein